MSVPAVLAPVTAAERHKRAIPRGLAATHMLAADRIMAEAAYDAPLTGTDLDVSRFQAEAVRERGLIPMSPDMVLIGVGGELVPTDSGKGAREGQLLNTVDNPPTSRPMPHALVSTWRNRPAPSMKP